MQGTLLPRGLREPHLEWDEGLSNGVGEIITAEDVILKSEATKNPVPGKQ